MIEQINAATAFLTDLGFDNADVGIVLGTGLSEFLHHINNPKTLAYAQIPHFPRATVEFHKGRLIAGHVGTKKVLAMQGRFHYYEGYSLAEVTFPIRVLKMLGIQHLFLSNAAGGINLSFKKGDLVAIADHINLLPDNPLRGENLDTLGPRFPDMSAPYDTRINTLLAQQASLLGITLKKGVYAAVTGPNLETRAEYRYLKIIGADVVGMSTVPEVIVANHMNLPCAAISVITDECDPDNLKPVNIAEIIAVAGTADKKLSQLLRNTIEAL